MSNYPSQLDPLDPAADAQAEAQADATAAAQALYDAPADPHRARRARALKLSIVSSVLTRPISLLLPLVTVPLFYKYLGGKERYGLYESIGAVALYIGMVNAGLTLGLINNLTHAEVKGDRLLARRYISSIVVALLALMIIAIALLSVVTPLIRWPASWVDNPLTARETPRAFWTASALIVIGFLAGVPQAVYLAYQETHRNNIWDGVAKLLSLVACFGVVWFPNLGIVGVILAVSGTQTLVRVVNLIDLLFREKRFLLPKPSLFSWRLLKEMTAANVLLFVLQMSSVVLFQSDKVIVGIGRGPEDVAGYSILGRLFLTGYGVYMMLLTPLWPASGEALRRGDVAWVRKSLRYSMVIGCGMMLAGGLALLLFTQPVLSRIKGAQGLTISRSLIVAVTLTFILRAWIDCRSIILNSVNVLLPQICFYTGHALLNLFVGILVVKRWGVEGVAWSTFFTGLISSAWGYPWMIRRFIMPAADRAQAEAVAGRAS